MVQSLVDEYLSFGSSTEYEKLLMLSSLEGNNLDLQADYFYSTEQPRHHE